MHESPLPRTRACGYRKHFQFLNDQSPTGAYNVLRAIRKAINEIAAYPFAAPRTSDADIRVKILGRYRYKIFYSVSDDAIEVIHIRHAARRPWIESSDDG